MLELSFGADGVELRPNFACASDRAQAFLTTNLRLDYRWKREHPGAGFSESSEQRVILEFANNCRPDSIRLKPKIQISSQGGVVGRQKHRCAVQRLGEVASVTSCRLCASHKDHATLTQEMAVCTDSQRGIDWRIGQHYVELVRR